MSSTVDRQCALTLVAVQFLSVFMLVPSVATGQTPACPGPALARLAILAGRWSVEWSYLVDGQLDQVEQATATIDTAAGGCVIRERLEGRLRGHQLAVHTIVAALNEDTLQRAYVDSDHGTLLVFDAVGTGDTIRFLWQRDRGTRQQVVRHEYLAVTRSAFVTETYMSPNGGGEWILVQRARYRRLTD